MLPGLPPPCSPSPLTHGLVAGTGGCGASGASGALGPLRPVPAKSRLPEASFPVLRGRPGGWEVIRKASSPARPQPSQRTFLRHPDPAAERCWRTPQRRRPVAGRGRCAFGAMALGALFCTWPPSAEALPHCRSPRPERHADGRAVLRERRPPRDACGRTTRGPRRPAAEQAPPPRACVPPLGNGGGSLVLRNKVGRFDVPTDAAARRAGRRTRNIYKTRKGSGGRSQPRSPLVSGRTHRLPESRHARVPWGRRSTKGKRLGPNLFLVTQASGWLSSLLGVLLLFPQPVAGPLATPTCRLRAARASQLRLYKNFLALSYTMQILMQKV